MLFPEFSHSCISLHPNLILRKRISEISDRIRACAAEGSAAQCPFFQELQRREFPERPDSTFAACQAEGQALRWWWGNCLGWKITTDALGGELKHQPARFITSGRAASPARHPCSTVNCTALALLSGSSYETLKVS